MDQSATTPATAELVSRIIDGSLSSESADRWAREAGAAAVEAVSTALRDDYAIDTTERLEAALKAAIGGLLGSPPDLAATFAVARAQRDLGYVLKYKSYAVKCAHPLGYSVFLQRPREGFSFQQHREHKVEVFHILEVQDGARVFLCEYEDWERIYAPDRFAAWLAGSPDAAFDRFAFTPAPGDVFVIDRLNVVHTILGCVLEEFATVSTDMVDRLHDQNAGSSIPPEFSRAYAERRVAAASYPAASRRVRWPDSADTEPIPEQAVEGGTKRVFADSFVEASHFTLTSGGPWRSDETKATAVGIKAGTGTVELEAGELPVAAGDVTTILPGVPYRVVPQNGVIAYTEHRIVPSTAFTPLAG